MALTYGLVEIIISPDDGDTYRQLRQTITSLQLGIIDLGNTPQSGAGPTRNRAINEASGEFFAVLDSDDWIPLNYIEELMKVARMHGAAISPTRYTNWDMEDVVRVSPVHNEFLSLSGFGQLLASPHPLIHRSLEIGYCIRIAEGAVHDGTAIARLGRVRVVPNTAYICRLRQGSACSGRDEAERSIQMAYAERIRQILHEPTSLGVQSLTESDRYAFAELFRFRAYVSKAFSLSGESNYHAWVANREATLWGAFRMESKKFPQILYPSRPQLRYSGFSRSIGIISQGRRAHL